MIAARLVPMLASMDTRMLMQLLQMANPAVASALSAYCPLPTAANISTPVSTACAQTTASTVQVPSSNTPHTSYSSAALLSTANVCVSTAGWPAPSTDAVCCGSTAFFSSLQSSICSSEGSSSDVPADHRQRKRRHRSPEWNSSPFDAFRPSSTASTSSSFCSSERRWPGEDTRDEVVYICHLCSFRSRHRTRFAEHLSSEFCAMGFVATTRRPPIADQSHRMRCSQCAFSTYVSEEFDEHVRRCVNSTVYHCSYCDYIGPSTGALKLHFRRRHPKRPFVALGGMYGSNSRAKGHDSDSGQSEPQSVDLDPVVKLYRM